MMDVICYLLSHRNPDTNVWEPVRMASREAELQAFVATQPGANDWHIRSLSFDMHMFEKAREWIRNCALEEAAEAVRELHGACGPRIRALKTPE